jgi:hypothetical protein
MTDASRVSVLHNPIACLPDRPGFLRGRSTARILERPFAERSRFKKRLLIGLAVWSLLMLAWKGVTYLSSLR